MLLTSPYPLSPSPSPADTAGAGSDLGIPGVLARWKADSTGVANGGNVSTWPDLSGNGRTLTVTGTAPVQENGGAFPVVRFNGSTGYYTTAAALFTGAAARTIAIAYMGDNAAASRGLCGEGSDTDGGNTSFMILVTAGVDPSLSPVGTAINAGYVNTNYKWAVATYDGTEYRLRTSLAANSAVVAALNTGNTAFWLGDIPSSVAFGPFLGRVAEVVVLDHAMTTDERTTWTAYCTTKYGT